MRVIDWGAFKNYVDRILPLFDPTAWTVFIPYAWTKTDIFRPPPPHLVHVVIEWPLAKLYIIYMSIKRQSNSFPKFDGNLRPGIIWWTEPVETWEKWPAADPQVLMSFGRHSGRHCYRRSAAAVAAHIL